ncbi:MAG: HAMP domain-containing histidine kinase [Bacteroidales bacterium]|nr:HAMP domain-containing histidine kinase [Bacteroidales bacterium]
MDFYTNQNKWKFILFLLGAIIILSSLWYSNLLVNKVRERERENIRIWASAIHKRAELVKTTDLFFAQLQDEERKKVDLLAKAYKKINDEKQNEELGFYVDIITSNTTIPVILTSSNKEIQASMNVIPSVDSIPFLEGELLETFSHYPPVVMDYVANEKLYLYYTDSRIFTETQNMLEDLNQSFINEVLTNTSSVPVIITDSSQKKALYSGNIEQIISEDSSSMKLLIDEMRQENTPILIELAGREKQYIFFSDSFLQKQLTYYPVIVFLAIGLFLLFAYLAFNTAQTSAQNKLWAGLAKETAHQIGTPLSSMLGWVELLKGNEAAQQQAFEIEKDLKRLETISERFSKIGSEPKLEPEPVYEVIEEVLSYLQSRTSSKVNFHLQQNLEKGSSCKLPLNAQLFAWVIENLCKNAIDAMGGKGDITLQMSETENNVLIDVSDTGKGISKGNFKNVFRPGFTSKKRGWGLGLSLAQRIIEHYHKGKIFVKNSTAQGTTFRIILKK